MVKPRRAARSRGFRRLLTASPRYWVSAVAVVACLVVVAGPWARPLSSMFSANDRRRVTSYPTLAPTTPSPESDNLRYPASGRCTAHR